jgi:hypothetical protein
MGAKFLDQLPFSIDGSKVGTNFAGIIGILQGGNLPQFASLALDPPKQLPNEKSRNVCHPGRDSRVEPCIPIELQARSDTMPTSRSGLKPALRFSR